MLRLLGVQLHRCASVYWLPTDVAGVTKILEETAEWKRARNGAYMVPVNTIAFLKGGTETPALRTTSSKFMVDLAKATGGTASTVRLHPRLQYWNRDYACFAV